MPRQPHTVKTPLKKRYYYGIELVECRCGVWRLKDDIPSRPDYIPCWNSGDRRQTMAEAWAQLNQAVRNLGYEIFKAVRLVK